jgi:hypothetical protein
MSICLIGSVDLSVAEHLKGFYSGYVTYHVAIQFEYACLA